MVGSLSLGTPTRRNLLRHGHAGILTGNSYPKNMDFPIYSSRIAMDVTLRQLRVFVAVADTRSFTGAGSEILPLARKTLADLDSVVGSSEQLRTLGRGRVSVAASSVQAALVMPRLVRAFTDRNPGVKIDVFDVSQDEVLGMVEAGAVDFGLGTTFAT